MYKPTGITEIRKKHRYLEAKCDCGFKSWIRADVYKKSKTKSCQSCAAQLSNRPEDFYKNIATTHGLSKTPTWKSWNSMRQRCKNPNDPRYKDWGGRGIDICSSWDAFENFYRDMGSRPEGHSLDRIDNDGDYGPNNCKWSTPKEQCQNRRQAL